MKKLKIHWSIVHRDVQVHDMLWSAGFNMQADMGSETDADGNVTYFQEEK